MKIEIEKSLHGTIKLGVLIFKGLNCQPRNDRLWEEIEQVMGAYRRRFQAPSEARELLKPARDLYRKIGIEPTRIRPSSEALLRRAIKGKSLYQINSIVDTGNLCSLKFLLPVGLYDLSKIEGDVLMRRGETGEEFPGIRKEAIHVGGRYTLADSVGAFGNPSSDSLRTSVDLDTGSLIFIIYTPFDYPDSELQLHLDLVEQKMLVFHQGVLVSRQTIE